MDGFVIVATHEMRDSADLETLLKYRYTWEPRTNVYYEPGMDKDEVFTVEAVETTQKFCEELAREMKEIK